MKALLRWLDMRMPTLGAEWRKHASEYYVPKNLNAWYEFGALAGLVLIIQIVSGIFLTMNYKPDANLAFGSVEYIMRDVPGGWIIRYVHSTGASAFFIVVYLHLFRALLYGSYKQPRELVWILGVLIYLTMIGEAFFGYLLLGPDVLLGRAGDRQPVRHDSPDRPGPRTLDSRRLARCRLQ
jgi:ubiquinol-cytochrome c reductase cytochrome b subunit